MIEQIIALDTVLFNMIYNLSGSWFDNLAILFTYIGEIYIIYLFALALFIKKDKKAALYLLPALILNTLLTGILKYGINRPRPFQALGQESLIHATSPSFPSGHTSRTFVLATVLSKFHPKFAKYLYSFAIIMALSRVYIGVHYPLDIISGAILGISVGMLVLRLPLKKYIKKIKNFLKI
jgi:undecaprenyl-diphosphatase